MRISAVALLIQHAKRMPRVVTSFVATFCPLKFSTLFRKRVIFVKQVIGYKMRVFIFSTTLSKHFLFYEEFSEISSKISKRLYVKYPLFLSDFK
jgi:hypothetical protein